MVNLLAINTDGEGAISALTSEVHKKNLKKSLFWGLEEQLKL